MVEFITASIRLPVFQAVGTGSNSVLEFSAFEHIFISDEVLAADTAGTDHTHGHTGADKLAIPESWNLSLEEVHRLTDLATLLVFAFCCLLRIERVGIKNARTEDLNH